MESYSETGLSFRLMFIKEATKTFYFKFPNLVLPAYLALQ